MVTRILGWIITMGMRLVFWGLPLYIIAQFFITIKRYVSARKKNKEVPGTYTDKELKGIMSEIIVLFVLIALFVGIVGGVIVLVSSSVAYM